jgi:hypothetical protein
MTRSRRTPKKHRYVRILADLDLIPADTYLCTGWNDRVMDFSIGRVVSFSVVSLSPTLFRYVPSSEPCTPTTREEFTERYRQLQAAADDSGTLSAVGAKAVLYMVDSSLERTAGSAPAA